MMKMEIFQGFLCVRGLKENVEHICNWVLHIQQKLQGLKILGEAGKQEILQQMFQKF